MGFTIQEIGFKVEYAEDGVEAFNFLTTKTPEQRAEIKLILTDCEMPNMTGFQLAHSLQPLEYSIPITLVTGHSKESVEERCAEAGIDDILEKPLNKDDLEDLVSKYC